MASSPAFAATPRMATAPVSTANTNRDGTGTIATVFTAGSSGSKITSSRIKADANPADSCIPIYLHDGSSYAIYDEFDLGDPAAASVTVPGYQDEHQYNDCILPNGWSLRASITAAPTSGEVNVFAAGGDF